MANYFSILVARQLDYNWGGPKLKIGISFWQRHDLANNPNECVPPDGVVFQYFVRALSRIGTHKLWMCAGARFIAAVMMRMMSVHDTPLK